MVSMIFSIFDSKAVQYGRPFFTQNRASAQRSLQLELRQDSKSVLAQYPADFSLYILGMFDDDTGLFTSHAPQFVIGLSELINAQDIDPYEDAMKRRAANE
jgi:hypothetical protein